MDLVNAKAILEEKNTRRNRLLGQKEMLLDNLKKIGYKDIKQAEEALKEQKDKISGMRKHYQDGVNKFKQKYGELLK